MTSKASERISALIALGKIDVVSMFREVRTIESGMERKPEEVETELRSKLRELFKPHAVEGAGFPPDQEQRNEPSKMVK